MKFQSKLNKDKFEQAVQAGLAEKTKEIASNFYDKIMEDKKFPEKTGYGRSKLRVRSRKAYGRSRYEITVEMPEYMWTITEGIPFSQGLTREAKGSRPHSALVFEWPQGEAKGLEKGYWNGLYFFRRVRFHIKQNDFITRAWRKVEKTRAYLDYSDFVETVFKKLDTF